jgi:hypothetical protein
MRANWIPLTVIGFACILFGFGSFTLMRGQRPPGRELPTSVFLAEDRLKTLHEPELRKHGWELFEQLVKPVGRQVLWQTWTSADDLFPTCQTPSLPLRRQSSLSAYTEGDAKPEVPAPAKPEDQLRIQVLFNPAAQRHICPESGVEPKLSIETLQATLKSDRHEIEPFDPKSVVVKALWLPLFVPEDKRKEGYVPAIPVWTPVDEGQGTSMNWRKWKKWVAVVSELPPDNKVPPCYFDGGEPPSILNGDPARKCEKVVLTTRFYRTPLTKNETWAKIPEGTPMVLAGLHLTTREIPNWFWATFWWSDQPDQTHSNEPPKSIEPPWNNYQMDVTISAEKRIDDGDKPHGHQKIPKCSVLEYPPDLQNSDNVTGNYSIAFNPYLEMRQANGIYSNCVACHQQAAWSPDGGVRRGVCGGSIQDDHPYFQNKVRTDFLWSPALQRKPK